MLVNSSSVAAAGSPGNQEMSSSGGFSTNLLVSLGKLLTHLGLSVLVYIKGLDKSRNSR